jgi:hypothetical protein
MLMHLSFLCVQKAFKTHLRADQKLISGFSGINF